LLAKLILAFITIPIVEIFLLFKIAEYLGAWETIAIVIITGVLGGIAAKHQGLKCWHDIKMDFAANINPSDRLWDGLFILIAAVLLITPGVLTDIVGFCLLFAPTRRPFKNYVKRKVKQKMESGTFHFRIY
jgi:UPF0716 protein FxsA